MAGVNYSEHLGKDKNGNDVLYKNLSVNTSARVLNLEIIKKDKDGKTSTRVFVPNFGSVFLNNEYETKSLPGKGFGIQIQTTRGWVSLFPNGKLDETLIADSKPATDDDLSAAWG